VAALEPFEGEERREQAKERISARITEESRVLPYRWGYFQATILIPWSLFLIFGSAGEMMKWHTEPWFMSVITLVMGLIGLPLAYGLLRKEAFALPLLYATVGLALLLVAVKLPIAITRYRESGDNGSAFSEAEILLVWIASLPSYRNRQAQFR
jgi:hypothetical protein